MKRARENVGPYTLCSGVCFSYPFPITTKTIVDLVHGLRERFGEGYEFNLEPITEGGIEMIHWPDKQEHEVGMLKTFRFHIHYGGEWPQITRDHLRQWEKYGYETVIWKAPSLKKPLKGNLYFKAFHGAPPWTLEEIGFIVSAFESLGFKCPKSKIPKKKNLQDIGDLGSIL